MSVATKARLRARQLAELEERKRQVEAELARPRALVAELDRLEDDIRAKSYSLENAQATADREYLDAVTEHEEATAALLDALPGFLDAFERALRSRVQVDAKSRTADEPPPPRLAVTKRLDRALLDRWRRVISRGFNV